MPQEIERKFLVDVDRWQPRDAGVLVVQGYLSSHPERVVRVRLAGGTAQITIKGVTRGLTRAEFEYPIPPEDARVLLDTLCEPPLVEKRRHRETHDARVWEIDVFLGVNAGLVVAEIELESEADSFARPPWVGREVSDDPRYFNANLRAHPYTTWPR